MTIKKKLEQIKKDNPTTIKEFVIDEILAKMDDYDGTDRANIKSWALDLQTGGCASGFVSSLIYYKETGEFYDEHEEEIWERLGDAADLTGDKNIFEFIARLNGSENVATDYGFKNLLAWFSFENTAFDLVNDDLGIEL
jgi:hypothetical protein